MTLSKDATDVLKIWAAVMSAYALVAAAMYAVSLHTGKSFLQESGALLVFLGLMVAAIGGTSTVMLLSKKVAGFLRLLGF